MKNFIPFLFIYLFLSIWSSHHLYSQERGAINETDIWITEKILGLEFDLAERDSMLNNLNNNVRNYQAMREYSIPNSIPPSVGFNPFPENFEINTSQKKIKWNLPKNVEVPANKEELCFYSVAELAQLIKSKKISSVELTQIYLDRLKKYGDTLECVVSLTEELALKQARKADEEIKRGNYRGALHGIPYGAKDLLAVPGYPTSWGAMPYKDQKLEETATVIKKLEEAGAVLVAKLTLGALAMGDVWYGGKTRNPWNLEQGSSGSSAGSASATAAGLVAFSIGTETLGSIVSPSTRCGVTGLRPSFGRVSRSGAMALSWSMDKIGPICRSAEDCALVFDAIRGTDGQDYTIRDAAFNFEPKKDITKMKIGYFKELFENNNRNKSLDDQSLEVLRALGVELIPLSLPTDFPFGAMRTILIAEAGAAFDELTRSDRDSLLVSQRRFSWPNTFRAAHFIPAVEYIQANRLRYQLIQEMHAIMQTVDVVVTPSFGGPQLLITNLTGHPCVVVPNGFRENGSPVSISFLGNLFDEASPLRVAKAYQEATGFDEEHPEMFKP